MKIGTKLGLGIGSLLGLLLFVGLDSYFQTRAVGEKLDELTGMAEPVNSAVYGLESALGEAAFASLGYAATGEQRQLDAFLAARDSFHTRGRKDLATVIAGSDGKVGATLERDFGRFHDAAWEQINLKNLQTQGMESLLGKLQSIDSLLSGRILASVSIEDPVAYRRLQATLEMQVHVNAITKDLGTFLLTGEPRFEERIRRAERSFQHFYGIYKVVLLSSEERAWAAELRSLADSSLQLARAIINLEKLRREQSALFMAVYRDMSSKLNDRLKTKTERNLAETKAELIQAGRAANNRILAVLSLGLVFGIGAGIITTRKITRPLNLLAEAMGGITAETPPGPIELQSNDELGVVAEAFNGMIARLNRALAELRGEIQERNRVEGTLRESELRFRTIFQNAPVGVALTGPGGLIIETNAALQEMLGVSAEKLKGVAFGEFLPVPVGIADRVDGPRPRYQEEITGRRADGREMWFNMNVSNVSNAPLCIVMMEDITEQRRLRDRLADAERSRISALRQFAGSVQRAQEEERSRISRELHDDLCQRLAGMKYVVEALEEEVMPMSRRAGRQLRDVRGEMDRAINEVRRISSNLRPSVLDDFGLVTALEMLCSEFRERHGIPATFEGPGAVAGDVLDAQREIALYRIAQEALSNVARHARATSVTVRLSYDDPSLVLKVADDGVGFIPGDAGSIRENGRGFGLISMRERSELLGGTFVVTSRQDAGTTLTVSIPSATEEWYEKDQNRHSG